MRQALAEPTLLANVLPGPSWSAWRTLLIAAMGEELDDTEREQFTALTGGRAREPLRRCEELALVIGRRGGKSRAMACLSVYLAALNDHPALVAGETGVLLVIAPDQRQAGITLGYAASIFEDSEVLGELLVNRTMDSLQLAGGISIEVRSSSFRRLRGPTYIGVVADEVAYLYSDEFSSNADTEIIEACRPGLSTTGGPLILCSSPYAKRGVLWTSFKQNYGPDGDPLLLVAKGSTRELNPSLPQRVVDRAYARDEASARAEYGAEFRSDVQSFVDPEVIEAATVRGRYELPPASGVAYAAFCDPSGGSSDSMTVAVGHINKDRIVIVDAIRECKAPFKPAQVVAEFVGLLKRYRLHKVTGDRYAGEWPRERFHESGVTYELAEKPKAALYIDALAVINSQRVELLDVPRLASQFISLERYSGRSNRDNVDHPPGGRDDVANAVAGLIVLLTQKAQGLRITAEHLAAVVNRGRAEFGGVGELTYLRRLRRSGGGY